MNAVPITRKVLVDWAGEQVLRDAESMVDNGLVVDAQYQPPFIKGIVLWNSRELKTSLKLLDDGTVESQCPCWANKERGVICSHVIALGVVLVRRQADPERAAKHAEEARRAERLSKISDGAYIQRVPEGQAGGLPAQLALSLPGDWQAVGPCGPFPLQAALEYRGERLPLDAVPRDTPFTLSKQDESILFVLEDISEGPAPGALSFRRYQRYARGGAGLIWFEATAVLHEGRSNPGQLTLTDETVGEFKRLVAESRRIAADAFGSDRRPVWICQLTHSGRYSKPMEPARASITS